MAAPPRLAMSLPPPGPRRPAWLKILLFFAFFVCLFNIAAYLYGLTLPNEWTVGESIVIAAPPEKVYPLVASPRRWAEWSSWSPKQDPSVEFAYDGPETGTGASFAWRGEQLGLGKLTMTEATPNVSVGYELVLQNAPFSKKGRIAFEPDAHGTRVNWTDGGELDSTLGRLFRERLEASVATEFRTSLQRLKEAAEREASRSG
jgi:Polyketide cyclase / dehydrase and lipid transport